VCTPIGSTFSIEHHLELELAPPDHRLLDQNLADRRDLQPVRCDRRELSLAARDPAAAPAQGECGPHDAGQADPAGRLGGLAQSGERLVGAPRNHAPGHPQSRTGHRGAEQPSILGARDRLIIRSDELHAETLQRAVVDERFG
jgi:hypothetical protein